MSDPDEPTMISSSSFRRKRSFLVISLAPLDLNMAAHRPDDDNHGPPIWIGTTSSPTDQSPSSIGDVGASFYGTGGQVKFGGPRGGGRSKNSDKLNSFLVEQQQRDNWCWAAVSVSVAKFFDPASPWTQCSLASHQLGFQCCVVPTTDDCDQVWTLEDPLGAVGVFQDMQPGSTTFEDMKGYIAADQPVCCYIGWNYKEGGHFVAIGGWVDGGSGRQYVDVHDPKYGFKQVIFDDFTDNYMNMGKWDYSYFVSKPNA